MNTVNFMTPGAGLIGGQTMPVTAAQNAAPPQMGNPMGNVPQMSPQMMQQLGQLMQNQNQNQPYSGGQALYPSSIPGGGVAYNPATTIGGMSGLFGGGNG
ncbi:MAG: hypothetical protein ACH344_08640 [Yersinia sp. (in: enterobacteria)]